MSPLEGKIWLSEVEWKAGADPALKHYSHGTILQFLSDGSFRLVECPLIGNAGDGKIGISRGDGYVRHNGTWKTAGPDRVDIRYRVDTSQPGESPMGDWALDGRFDHDEKWQFIAPWLN